MSVPRAAARLLLKELEKKAAKKAVKKYETRRLSQSLRRAPVRWKIPPGKRRLYESIFEDNFGPKPRGVASWNSLAERYPERFRDYVNDAEEAA